MHSPLAYSLVREVFMQRGFLSDNREVYNFLLDKKVGRRSARQLQNLVDFKADYKINFVFESEDYSFEQGFMNCVFNFKLRREFLSHHCGMSIDKRAYCLILNDENYRKQHYRL